jgi:hypothetical protein
MTLEQKIAFFETHHYLFLPAALNAEELAALNAAIDRDRQQYPQLWSTGPRMQSAQCLLSIPEADLLIRHPSFFPVAEHVLDGDIRFEEFSIMIRAGGQPKGAVEGWHRDCSPNPEHRRGIRALGAFIYLTDVDETTARYTLVPNSQYLPEPPKVCEDPEEREGEIEMLGPAGSVILVNAGNWHCGKWGHGPRERRMAATYYGQSSTPSLSNHTLFPRRLWDVVDEEQRRFYSKFNAITRAVVGDYCRD